jgi:hypothetical protein
MVGTVVPAELARSPYIRNSTKVVKGRSMRFMMAMAALNRSLPPADKKSQIITLIPHTLILQNIMKYTSTICFHINKFLILSSAFHVTLTMQ